MKQYACKSFSSFFKTQFKLINLKVSDNELPSQTMGKSQAHCLV